MRPQQILLGLFSATFLFVGPLCAQVSVLESKVHERKMITEPVYRISKPDLRKARAFQYDPQKTWANYIQSLGPGVIVRQKVYSRGNDEGGETEGSYETARMYANVIAKPTPENAYQVYVELWATISTPEASHARSVFPYWIRMGTKKSEGPLEILAPSSNAASTGRFQYLDGSFAQRIQNGQNLNSRNQWIRARAYLGAHRLGPNRAGAFGFVQSHDQSRNAFVSNQENHSSVKHKIEVYSEYTEQNTLDLKIDLKQPTVTTPGRSADWLQQFLRELGTYEYRDGSWTDLSQTPLDPFIQK